MQLNIVKSEPSTPTKITVVETIYDCISDPYRLRRLLQLTYFLLKHQRHQILSLTLSLSVSLSLWLWNSILYPSLSLTLCNIFIFVCPFLSLSSFPYSLFSLCYFTFNAMFLIPLIFSFLKLFFKMDIFSLNQQTWADRKQIKIWVCFGHKIKLCTRNCNKRWIIFEMAAMPFPCNCILLIQGNLPRVILRYTLNHA